VRRVDGDTLRFAAVTYFAYFPSKAFPVHEELGSRDLLDEVSRECRRQQVHLYAYTVYGAYFVEVGWVNQHPEYADWIVRDPEGKPYAIARHSGWPGQYKVCITGDAYRSGMRQVVRELCEHDVEGVYFDAPCSYRAVCFCENCRTNFRKFSGLDLDRLGDFVSKYALAGLPNELGGLPESVDVDALAAWYRWANQLVREDLLDFRKIIHGSGKFMLCHNGPTWRGGTALHQQYRIPDGFMVEHIAETHQRLTTGLMGASMGRASRQLVQMYLGSYTVSMAGEPAHEQPWSMHNCNLEDADEVVMEGFADLACGNAPIYCTANRLYFGIGGGSNAPARQVFSAMRELEAIAKDSVPVPYVSLVPTWDSLQIWHSHSRTWNVSMGEAFVLAMLDARISIDVNPSTELSDEWLARQRVIALCGASGISDEAAMKLTSWVKDGGGLLATYDTGLFNQQGRMRSDGGALRDILGVDMLGPAPDSLPESYYRLQKSHPALPEQDAGSMLQGDGQLIPVKVRPGAELVADCWSMGTGQSRGPAIVEHAYGKGRSIYIAGSLEAHYACSRVASLRRALQSIVTYLSGGQPQPFRLTAPTGVYGVLRRARNGDLVLWLLANVGFKDAAAGRMRQEFVPVSNVEVAVRVPHGRHVRAIHLARAPRELLFEESAGYVTAVLPSLHIAEVLHVQLA
jgi:hypothetical protein